MVIKKDRDLKKAFNRVIMIYEIMDKLLFDINWQN